MNDVKIAVIGGSGLYQIPGVEVLENIEIETPFGKPSDEISVCRIDGSKVAFLPRHGRGHRITPSELPVKANIYALKSLGVKYVISVSAVGSLRQEIKPRDIVIPSQIIDRTSLRERTFFGGGIVAHVIFADPFCSWLSGILQNAAQKQDVTVHEKATYVCMEGPLFSTRAESQFHRMIGGDIIGMTAIPEAKLAREAEMCYATIALSTDYDCWHEEEEDVTLEMILDNMKFNSENAKNILLSVIHDIDVEKSCSCHSILDYSIVTDKKLWPEEKKKELELLLKRFL